MSATRCGPVPLPEACGCGTGLAVATPLVIDNRAGLSAIACRSGDHAAFRRTLLARLTLAGEPALARLTTRDDGDFTIGLLDAWAAVGDVLTFYQERIANESYLATATERLSVLELAALIGYRPGPGVAATAWLAFTAEDPPGTTRRVAPTEDDPDPLRQNAVLSGVPASTIVDVGLKVQSVPGPGETAQVFETVERIEARPEWNAIRARLTTRQPVTASTDELLFAGLATGLRKGDPVLLSPDAGGDLKLRRVTQVTLEERANRTRVKLSAALDAGPAPDTLTYTWRSPGTTAAKFIGTTVRARDLRAFARTRRFAMLDLFDNLAAVRPPPSTVFALRSRAAIFGHNAPAYDALPASQRIGEYAPDGSTGASSSPKFVFEPGAYAGRSTTWVDRTLSAYPGEPAGSRTITLDAVHASLSEGSWVVLEDGDTARTYRIDGHVETSRSDFTLSAKVTRLRLNTAGGLGMFGIRTTTVLGESETLDLARLPLTNAVSGDEIALEGLVDGLDAGRHIVVCGELEDQRGVTACEIAEIAEVEHDLSDAEHLESFTKVRLAKALAHAYVRATVSINANVARATHGETVQTFGAGGETLGGGDASVPFQRFTLAQSPLTYVSSATGTGTRSTLEVRVNDVAWTEADTLFGRGPVERVYVTARDDDGRTSVVFGDGENGARLPTGQGNVTARYRKGIGSGGRVRAKQLSQLLTRPLGIRAASNPVKAEGGADPETLDRARDNAPLGVLTLGRIVSLQDFEDFARAFTGVAKARAVRTRTGMQDGVFVTVAGEDGTTLDENGTIVTNLLGAMRDAGDPGVPLEVRSHVPRVFRFSARVATRGDLERDAVLGRVGTALREHYSFERRAFGQPVHASGVVATIQNVDGVTACVLDELYIVALEDGATIPEETPGVVHGHLPAAAPIPGTKTPTAAELLLLDDVPLTLGVLA
ncbi:MAG: putative baseplate assembly protein [Betaproteobacteria bacterium]|nr:putative baseplate assembly protein [Betaproteobacteria bacterium]